MDHLQVTAVTSHESPPSQQSPHPKACKTCSTAKVKCVYDNGARCQRCQRLQRLCEPAVTRVRAKRRPNTERKNRVEKLEARLDGLVTLLKSNQQNNVGSHGDGLLGQSPNHADASSSGQRSNLASLASFQTTSNQGNGTYGPGALDQSPKYANASSSGQRSNSASSFSFQATSFVAAHENPPNLSPSSRGCVLLNRSVAEAPTINFDITGDEDPDVLLDIFRLEMSNWLPFISLEDEVRAKELHTTQPFLYLTIMTIATRNSLVKAELGAFTIQQLADRVVVRSERSIDLLLGVLVFAAWSAIQFFNVPRVTNLISTASTILGDLRLSEPPFKDSPQSFLSAIRASCSNQTLFSPIRSMQERRAYLGHHLLCSTVAILFRRVNPPNWTAYSEECLQLLSNSGQFRDRHAVALIRLQMMLDKAPQTPWHTTPDFVCNSGSNSPLEYSRNLERQLHDLRRLTSPDVMAQMNVQLTYHNVEILMYRIGLSKSAFAPTLDALGMERLTILHSCSTAVKSFLEVFSTIPASDYQAMPITIYAQLTYALGTLHLLSTFKYPGWSPHDVHDFVNIRDVLHQTSEKFNDVKHTVGFDRHTTERIDEFSNAAQSFKYLMVWMDVNTTAPPISEQAGVTNGDGSLYNPSNSMDYMDSLDNSWLSEMFGNWDPLSL